MKSKRHPEQGYRACLGVMRLGKKHGNERLDKACRRALALHSPSYKTISAMLDSGLEDAPTQPIEPSEQTMPEHHENIRGSDYYH